VLCRAEAEYSNAATQQEAERAEKAIKAAVAALKVSSLTKQATIRHQSSGMPLTSGMPRCNAIRLVPLS
jgi:hypothetical protein